MKNDGERLLKIIRDKIPMMTEEELRQMTRMLQKIKIEHLPEMKENGILSREIFFPELTRLKAFDGVEKCSFGRWLQWKKTTSRACFGLSFGKKTAECFCFPIISSSGCRFREMRRKDVPGKAVR